MAKSKYEYVKGFEYHSVCLPSTYIVVRIDGHSFHRFTATHNFEKPNDIRGLNLANHAARLVVQETNDIILAYGQSDEYSFVLDKRSTYFKRRESKILSTLVSLFTAHYMYAWNLFFPGVELQYPPSFDARIVLYPNEALLKDYFSWRQVDCHINNMYNTLFWALVQDKEDGKSQTEAQLILKDTDSAAKNEMLYSKFGINYNALPDIYRKGTVIRRRKKCADGESVPKGSEKPPNIIVEHIDIINEGFWIQMGLK
ncbi:tRNAHis guanylyltransferase-domain-containing protein [Chytridium lagenaria]|nr:tRNAHis guanylyltransferase-domain-containing protein [Chytridium lagenaria]